MLKLLYWHFYSVTKPNQNIHFSANDLKDFIKLSPRQQSLLVDMISEVKTNHQYNSIINDSDYSSFGYSNRQNFHRDKRAIEAAGWIITEGKQYVICLHKVMCGGKEFYKQLMIYLGLKPGVVMGQKFNPGSPPIPKPPKS